MPKEVLPDCRAKVLRGAVRGRWGNWVPIFCGNCGADGGFVPEENMTWAFWLCTPCWEKHGALAATMAIPDEIVWEQIRQDQLGRAKENEEKG